MTQLRKHLLKMAGTVHQRLIQRDVKVGAVTLPTWEDVARPARQLEMASRRRWHLAAARLKCDLTHEIRFFSQRLANLAIELESTSKPVTQPLLADVYADLVTLEDDFPEITWDREKRELQVTTEPIELRGMDFGRFKICLEFSVNGGACSYYVVALDARPAASNESVTHPHVSNESLCEGEGREAIRAALDSGRLLDFVTIVVRLLNTYAAGQAYVELEHWDGLPCNDCGSTVDEDDRWICEKCDAYLCGGCGQSCSQCSSTFCASCISICVACDEPCCRSCLDDCQVCGRRACTDCLENNCCPSCQPEEPDDENPISSAAQELSANATADTAIQPHGLGQVALPA